MKGSHQGMSLCNCGHERNYHVSYDDGSPDRCHQCLKQCTFTPYIEPPEPKQWKPRKVVRK